MYDPKIVSLIWRNFGSLDIIRDFAPGTDREERELFDAITQTRAAIEKLRHDLPATIEAALRKGFTPADVLKVILDKSEGLIPRWNAEVLVSGVQAKIEKENQAAREASEKAEAEKRMAAIEKRINDAKQALRDMGATI